MSGTMLLLRAMVLEQVRAERTARGLAASFVVVARRFGCSPRRVRGWWYGEVKEPKLSEAQRIRAAFKAFVEKEASMQPERLTKLRQMIIDADAQL